jgi:hypothetical protein
MNASGFSLRQRDDKSSYDGRNQYEDERTPNIAIPQPSVLLKSQHILCGVFERRI